MDRETLKHISTNDYRDYLEDEIYDNIDFALNIGKGHVTELHVNMSDTDLLERMINEEKNSVSSFYFN